MRCRIVTPLLVIAALLAAAFSTGSAVFLSGAVLLVLVLAFSLASVCWAAATMTVGTDAEGQTVRRGEDMQLAVYVRHGSLLPIAPVRLELLAAPETPGVTVTLTDMARRQQRLTIPFHASHVGVSRPGVKRCTVEDLFGFFSRSWEPERAVGELLVLPTTFEVDELTFAPGDPGLGTMARATEDITSPSDVRTYQPGDPMKKIHWKLSLRKNDLMVRRFEEPVLPDALVLMDCSEPGYPGEAGLDVRDALLETAASVMEGQMRSDHNIRMPLNGVHPVEVGKGMGMPLVLENLARVDFSETDRFDRVLMLETRRLRQMGAVVVITSHLSGRIVETMTSMRRMGPVVRLYLVTFDPEAAEILPFVARLQRALVEVCYVTPMHL